MAFEKTGNLLASSFKKYGLTKQVSAALMCENAKNVLAENFSVMSPFWNPTKFIDGGLHVAVSESAARSKLFLETQNILEIFSQHEVLKRVRYIKIVREDLNRREF